jgi:Glycosyltransferase Family 4
MHMPSDRLMRPLRILITNNTLGERAGSELFVRDLALGLVRKGHNPIAYSTVLGPVAGELEAATVPVVDNLAKVAEPPDIIHGQHHLETMTAALHFPESPAIFVCHGWIPWEEKPPLFPSIRRYVAVDDLCRERLLMTEGIESGQVSTIYNFADLDRFLPRQPLPPKPRSVLVFSNNASDVHDAIRDECRSSGIERLEVAGLNSGRPTARPEEILGQYDIVFAKGRAAIEALATGCAVVVSDYSRTAGMVTSANLDELRRLNFGVRTLQKPLTREAVQQAFASYDPADAGKIAAVMRSTASLTGATDRYLTVYDEVIRAWRGRSDRSTPTEALARASRYLHWLSPVIKDRHAAIYRAEKLGYELDRARSGRLKAELDSQQRAGQLESELADARSKAAALREEVGLRDEELASIKASRAWRAVQAYGRIKNKLWKP